MLQNSFHYFDPFLISYAFSKFSANLSKVFNLKREKKTTLLSGPWTKLCFLLTTKSFCYYSYESSTLRVTLDF